MKGVKFERFKVFKNYLIQERNCKSLFHFIFRIQIKSFQARTIKIQLTLSDRIASQNGLSK